MKMKNQLLVLTILLVTYYSEAYKILVVSPFPGKSHSILGRAVVRHLSNAGHEITYITAFPHEKPAAGVREIDVSCNTQCLSEPKINIESILKKEQDIYDLKFIAYVNMNVSSHALECEAVNKILTDPKETFDVIIAEWMFSELYATLAAVYQCPLIWLSSLEPHWRVLMLIDEIPNPSYNPDVITSNDVPLSFTQRLQELTFQIVGLGINYFYAYDLDKTNYNKIVVPIIRSRGNPVPTFEELKYNASLMLGNSHISMGRATRLPPLYKSVGGYHIDEDVKPLPADLKNILDNAKNGVVYFSMGSTLRSSMMPNELIQSLLKMFSGLKQIVLWKFEGDLPNRPSNVHILQWAPQLSILAHPNCRVFVTHGGLLSTTEAIYFGKPLIVIPVFADQFGNAERAVSKGFAVKVDLSYTMASDIKAAINEIFNEPKYAAKAKALSLIYHDRPVPPGKELVHWVEHVVKTNGALHLRSPALHLPFYQKLYLDLLAIILIILYVIKVVIKMIFAKICGKKKVKVLDHKKKNK